MPIPQQVMAEVTAHIQAARLTPDDYLFAEPDTYFRRQSFYNRQWKPACAGAGLPGVRYHDLRHTFASLRAQQGVPPHVRRDWMGHSSIVTTMNIYSHVYEDDRRHAGTSGADVLRTSRPRPSVHAIHSGWGTPPT